MNLDLRDFTVFPVDLTIESEADAQEYELQGITVRDLMTVKMNIHKVKEEYYCQGIVRLPVEEECSRCLNLFDAELSGDFSFIVKTGSPEVDAATVAEDEIIYINTHEPVIDLTDTIRQSLVLAIPMKPLCSEDCRGLCPNCGANLNEETCECRLEDTDERWDGLKDLLE